MKEVFLNLLETYFSEAEEPLQVYTPGLQFNDELAPGFPELDIRVKITISQHMVQNKFRSIQEFQIELRLFDALNKDEF